MDYAEVYTELHDRKPDIFRGFSVIPHVKTIKELVDHFHTRNILDYGCGKGHQYSAHRIHEQWGIMPRLYDPGVREFALEPMKASDGVICTDVMEHIAEEDVLRTLKHVFSLSKKWVFFSISTVPAKKTFDDGTNVHLTVKSEEWWMNRIRKVAKKRYFVVRFMGDDQ
jgi:hypothetical protein